MSDDISLARSPRSLTDAESPPTASAVPPMVVDEELPGRWLWNSYFTVALVGVIGFVLGVDQQEPVAERFAATGLLLALALWYMGFGQRVIRDDDRSWRGYLYLVGILVLYVPAVALVDSSSFALFGLCPQAYMALPMAPATGFVILMSLTPAAVFLARTGDIPQTLAVMVPFGLVVIAFSTVTAVTIIRIERRSEERAALIRELASTRAEIARLSHEAGIAAERQRLAGEIHDTVAQGLSSVVMLVQAADAELTRNPEEARRHLAMAARTARENLDEARAMVGALTPALAEASLTDALRRLAERFTTEHGVRVAFVAEGTDRALPTGIEVVLLRVAQEALNNVRKHSGANKVSVRLAYRPTSAALEVSDDGCGFSPSMVPTGYGLGAMRSRVEQIGGAFTIHSAPGAGTSVRTEVDA